MCSWRGKVLFDDAKSCKSKRDEIRIRSRSNGVNELNCEATAIIRSNVNKELLRRSPLEEVRFEHF